MQLMQRASLSYKVLETFCLEPSGRIDEELKRAARAWARRQQPPVLLRDFRSARETAAGLETVARCRKCEACEKRYRFRLISEKNGLKLEISSARDCSGVPRLARKGRKSKEEAAGPTVEEREAAREAMDNLATRGCPIAAKAVALKISTQSTRINPATLRSMVRQRRKTLGTSTQRFRESAEQFEEFAALRRDRSHHVQFASVSLGAATFSWIAVLVPFLDRLEDLHKKHGFVHWAATTDWTTRVCHMDFQYGFICAICFKLLGNNWLKGALPLVACCAPQEAKDIYSHAFVCLRAELVRRGIPLPSSLHADWFGGGCLRAPWQTVMGQKSRFVCGAEHMTRAITRNNRRGQCAVERSMLSRVVLVSVS